MSSKTLNERPNLQFWYQRRLLGFLKAGKYDQDILTCVASLAGDDIKATARTVLPSMTVKAKGWSLTSLPPNIVECLDDRLRELCPGGKQWRFGGMPPLERTKTEAEGYYYYPVGKPPVGADITTKLPCPAIPEAPRKEEPVWGRSRSPHGASDGTRSAVWDDAFRGPIRRNNIYNDMAQAEAEQEEVPTAECGERGEFVALSLQGI